MVYQVPCSNCYGTYIGETCQLLEKRMARHKLDIEKQIDCTALSSHHNSTGHNSNFNDVSILGRASNIKKREFLKFYTF